jgi:hypothetical protein
MPKPTKSAPVKSSASPKKARPAAKTSEPSAADEAAYLDMLIKTGQAVPAGRGPMPSGATHALETDDAGRVKPVRRRASIV